MKTSRKSQIKLTHRIEKLSTIDKKTEHCFETARKAIIERWNLIKMNSKRRFSLGKAISFCSHYSIHLSHSIECIVRPDRNSMVLVMQLIAAKSMDLVRILEDETEWKCIWCTSSTLYDKLKMDEQAQTNEQRIEWNLVATNLIVYRA